MPVFRFHARDAQGRPQSGSAQSANSATLIAELRGRGLLVFDVQQAQVEAVASARSWNPLAWLPPGGFDVETGLQQIASMLRSGLTLLAALKTASEQSRRPRMAAVWRNVYERIEEGASFSDALEAHPRAFSSYIVQLVRVGEHSGALEKVLTRAAEHLERTRALRLTLINALIYPAIVVVMAVAVAAFMLLGVIPKIQKFLAGRGRGLPAITQLLLDVSNWLQAYGPHVAVGIVASCVALLLIYRWPPGRFVIDGLLLRVPIVGYVLRLSGTAIFARGLATLLESGVTLLDGLRTIERLVVNRAMVARVNASRQAVLSGGTLADALAAGPEFQVMLARMVAVGETTGALDPVLNEVAQFHEHQLAATVRRLSVLVEPAIIVVVGGIVGFVYIAFFVAMFSLAGGVR